MQQFRFKVELPAVVKGYLPEWAREPGDGSDNHGNVKVKRPLTIHVDAESAEAAARKVERLLSAMFTGDEEPHP